MGTNDAIRKALGGQSAPASEHGGARVLYRCAACGKPWYQNGTKHEIQLSPARLAQLAQELEADIAALPYADCMLCAWRGNGLYEMDEYSPAQGYGVSWEGIEPTGAHVLITGLAQSYVARLRSAPHASVVTDAKAAKAYLAWLASLPMPAQYQRPNAAMLAAQAADNPPGHKAPGTARWQWQGIIWQVRCQPLGGAALCTASLALPPDEKLDVPTLVALARHIGAVMHAGHLAGERDSMI